MPTDLVAAGTIGLAVAVLVGFRVDPRKGLTIGAFCTFGLSALLGCVAATGRFYGPAAFMLIAATLFALGAAGVRRRVLLQIGAASSVMSHVVLHLGFESRGDFMGSAFYLLPPLLVALLAVLEPPRHTRRA